MNEVRYIRVVPENSYSRAYDYAVPETLLGRVELGMKVRIPLRTGETTGFVIEFLQRSEFAKVRAIYGVIGERPYLPGTLFALARWLADYYASSLAAALRCVLPEPVRQDMGALLRLWVELRPNLEPERVEKELGRAQKQREAYRHLCAAGGGWLHELIDETQCGRAVWQGLADRGFVILETQAKERDPFRELAVGANNDHALNAEQTEVLRLWRMEANQPEPQPFLLHGVTGSGKTEIYLRAIADVLEAGKTALMIVPEIALTSQVIDRFRARFFGQKIRIAVLHSHLARGEKYDQWQQVRDGRARIVIGARSAVFAPLADLGLIVVDEEHEHSYKQEEAPHYHGRDVAVMRGRLEKIPVLLGSATPSLESWHNAQTGKYRLGRLTERVEAQQMPTMHIVDLRQKRVSTQERTIIAPCLQEAVEQRLERGEQVILYLNRRGHSTQLQCPDCGHVEMCPRCSVTLTYHRSVEKLRCHLCDYAAPLPRRCPTCSSKVYVYGGQGTQKIEEEVEAIFPQARLLRMDSDSMRKKGAYQKALGQFGRGEIDILVGTQMIAKGLHFPRVTCVGVINLDGTLQMPDFRASERVFQQIMQVSGRAGRSERGGEVFVQTRTPFHPAIQFARHHDYAGFVEQELEFRRALHYPPYTRAMLLHWRGRNEEKTLFVAEQIFLRVKEALGSLAECGEVAPAPIARIDHYYRYHALLRTKRVMDCSRTLRPLILETEWPEGVMVSLEVDPQHLL